MLNQPLETIEIKIQAADEPHLHHSPHKQPSSESQQNASQLPKTTPNRRIPTGSNRKFRRARSKQWSQRRKENARTCVAMAEAETLEGRGRENPTFLFRFFFWSEIWNWKTIIWVCVGFLLLRHREGANKRWQSKATTTPVGTVEGFLSFYSICLAAPTANTCPRAPLDL